MAHENVGVGESVPDGKIKTIGPRGGVKYDSAISSSQNQPMNVTGDSTHPPTYILIGPGVDMAFFRKEGGIDIRYNGPYCEEAIKMAKAMASSGSTLKEIIDEICKEYNCKVNDENSKPVH